MDGERSAAAAAYLVIIVLFVLAAVGGAVLALGLRRMTWCWLPILFVVLFYGALLLWMRKTVA